MTNVVQWKDRDGDQFEIEADQERLEANDPASKPPYWTVTCTTTDDECVSIYMTPENLKALVTWGQTTLMEYEQSAPQTLDEIEAFLTKEA